MAIVQLNMFEGKVCSRCKSFKLYLHFSKDRSKRNGYSSLCKECRGLYNRKYWHDTIERRHEYRKEYVKTNRDVLNQKKKEYYSKNSERIKTQVQSYRDAHGEEHRRRSREWSKRNPERTMVIRQRRRTLERNSDGSFTTQQWQALCVWFDNTCLKCRETTKLTPDHVIPLSRGGSNDISNIQPLCFLCNTRKHTRIIDYRDPDRLAAFLEHISGTQEL